MMIFPLHIVSTFTFMLFCLLPTLAAGQIKVVDLAVSGDASRVFRTRVDGRDVRTTAFKDIHYVHIVADRDAEIAITALPGERIESFVIRPKHFGITGSVSGNQLVFRANGRRKLVVEVNRYGKLFIFLEPPDLSVPRVAEAGVVSMAELGVVGDGRTDLTKRVQSAIDSLPRGGTLYFPAGHYRTGTLRLRGDMSLYLAAGALLQASDDFRAIRPVSGLGDCIGYLVAQDVSNVRIAGYGVIDANGYHVRRAHEAAAHKRKQSGRLLAVLRSSNITLEGVTLRDPYSWNTHLISSRDVVIRNVKLLNDVRLGNGDGFDIDRCRDVLVEDCFVFAEDDALSPKARTNEDLHNLTFRNCILWSHNANGIRVGTESSCRVMGNFIFEDITILHAKAMIRLDSLEGAVMENFTFRDIWCEDFHQYADPAAASYPRKPVKPGETYLVSITVRPDARKPSRGASRLGLVRNVLFERISWDEARVGSKLRVADEVREPRIQGVEFRDCRLRGRSVGNPLALRLTQRGPCADIRVTGASD